MRSAICLLLLSVCIPLYAGLSQAVAKWDELVTLYDLPLEQRRAVKVESAFDQPALFSILVERKARENWEVVMELPAGLKANKAVVVFYFNREISKSGNLMFRQIVGDLYTHADGSSTRTRFTYSIPVGALEYTFSTGAIGGDVIFEYVEADVRYRIRLCRREKYAES